jgi:hypothetical protein
MSPGYLKRKDVEYSGTDGFTFGEFFAPPHFFELRDFWPLGRDGWGLFFSLSVSRLALLVDGQFDVADFRIDIYLNRNM